MNTYEKFESLLRKNNVKTIDVAKATNIATSTFTDWKKGRSEPKIEKMKRISDYFQVSLDYFINDEAIDFLRNQNTIKLSDDAIDVAAQYATRPPEIQEMIRRLLKYSEHQS